MIEGADADQALRHYGRDWLDDHKGRGRFADALCSTWGVRVSLYDVSALRDMGQIPKPLHELPLCTTCEAKAATGD